MWRTTFIVFLASLSGCATTSPMNQISLGMTKQHVIEILGPPRNTSAKPGIEYLIYRQLSSGLAYGAIFSSEIYFVRIVDNKVESYGRLGDFDSTKAPEIKSTIDLNIDTTTKRTNP